MDGWMDGDGSDGSVDALVGKIWGYLFGNRMWFWRGWWSIDTV